MEGLKDIVRTYRNYLSDSEDRFADMHQKITSEHKQRVADEPGSVPTTIRSSATHCFKISVWCWYVQKQMLDQALEQEYKRLEEDLKLVREYTIESLKNSLKSVAPEPKMLDVRSALFIPQKNASLSSIYIRPSATINSLQNDIEEYFLKQGNPIQGLDTHKMHIVFVPPERKVLNYKLLNEGTAIQKEDQLRVFLGRLEAQGFTVRNIASEELFLKHELRQNGAIYVYGLFSLKSEAPAECLTYKYQGGKVADYFSCSECNVNCTLFDVPSFTSSI